MNATNVNYFSFMYCLYSLILCTYIYNLITIYLHKRIYKKDTRFFVIFIDDNKIGESSFYSLWYYFFNINTLSVSNFRIWD